MHVFSTEYHNPAIKVAIFKFWPQQVANFQMFDQIYELRQNGVYSLFKTSVPFKLSLHFNLCRVTLIHCHCLYKIWFDRVQIVHLSVIERQMRFHGSAARTTFRYVESDLVTIKYIGFLNENLCWKNKRLFKFHNKFSSCFA